MKSSANYSNDNHGFLQQQQPIHAAEVLDFFDDLGVFADLDIEAESTVAGAPLYQDAPPASGAGDSKCALLNEAASASSQQAQFQSFSALLDSELQLTDDFDVGALSPMEPLLQMHLHENENNFGSMDMMNSAAAGASHSLALEHELLYFTSDCDSDHASSVASEPVPVETEVVERPKKKKKKKSTSQRQKEELSYLRGKLYEYENELKKIASENEKNGGDVSTGATGTAGGEVDGTITARVKALSLWETMAKNQLEEKNRAEMENAALRQKMEAQLKFAKSLERMLRKRRIWDGIQEPSQQRFMTLSVKDSEAFDALRNNIEARARTVDDVFYAQGFTKLSPPKRDTNIVLKDEGGMRIDFVHCTVVPFAPAVVSSIVWEYLQKRELKLSNLKLTTQVVEQSEDFMLTTQRVTSDTPSDIRCTTVHSVFKRIHQGNRTVFVYESVTECKASVTRGTPAAQLHTMGCGQIIHQVDPQGGSTSSILQSYVSVVPTLGQEEVASGLSPSHDETPRSLDTGLLTELTISAYEQNAQTVRQAIENALIDDLLRSG